MGTIPPRFLQDGDVLTTEIAGLGRLENRIRIHQNEEVAQPAGVAVIAVGAISTYDDVNSVLLAGRADLVALGRTHLYDPQWTLHAAAEQEYQGPGSQWIPQFRAGRRKPPSSRTDAVRPRLSLLKELDSEETTSHLRWTPAALTPEEVLTP